MFWDVVELQDLVGSSPELCNFGSSDEAQIPRPGTGRSLASAPDRHDRHAPRTGEAGGADRLGVLRDGVGRVLPLAYGTPGDVAAVGGGSALSAAHLPVVGRGRGRPLGGEPLLSAFLR